LTVLICNGSTRYSITFVEVYDAGFPTQMDEITKLLNEWNDGDQEALDKLMRLVVQRLKEIARGYMRGERPGHILQPTALVNEALIKLIPKKISFENRKHFYRLVKKKMRHILVNYAKKESTEKGGKRQIEQLAEDQVKDLSSERPREILRLDQALTELAKTDERKATIIEHHFFGGLTVAEVAKVLGVSKTTVERELKFTRSWLKREMTKE